MEETLPAKGDRVIIAVDGPAGAGKGAVCRAVAERFGLAYLETGAIYRAVGLLALRQGVSDEAGLAELARTMPFSFRSVGPGRFGAYLGEEEVTAQLREEAVGEAASKAAALPEVRRALLHFQRGYGGPPGVILDGRDVGTVVWPEADLKIFLTASLEERAKRRALELREKGETASLEEIRQRMAERDARDSSRTHAPLLPATDAVTLDTTPLTLDESIARVTLLVASVLHP
ncbi:MAG: (d)CMP kinase [Magnetococcales bacterium]|nr:(d)CMP kinase [Magnetococcales bacterium]